MASPADAEAVAVAQANGIGIPNVNGLADADADASQSQSQLPSQAHSDASQASGPSTKRKREDSDDGFESLKDTKTNQPTILFSDDQPLRDERKLIRNYFQVLQSLDTTTSILKRPLPDPSTADEPQSKKQKPDDSAKPVCIEDKVNQDVYKLLDQLVLDLKQAIEDKNVELRSAESKDGVPFDDKAIVQLDHFKEKALAIHNRELAYPQTAPPIALEGPANLEDLVQKPAEDNTVLTIFGQAPQGRHLFSSLPKRKHTHDHSDNSVKPLTDLQLPYGLSTTSVLPAAQPKPTRVPDLGEMFPSSANLPVVEAPKPPKSAIKGKVLGYYHPELADRSSYGHNKDSYYLKELSTGVWLDYSNAAPPTKNQDRRRERTLSLAGQTPSSVELEVNEMEALFRGAFSSFAPEKDDSGAVISSGELGRLWYQRQGYRYLQQLMDAELDESDEVNEIAFITPAEEEEIANAVENWDDSLVDPSLSDGNKSKKTEEDKEVEDTLQEISDLIETLASYQRNRHLTMPTSQNRNATDPAKADMLNGSQAQEPSEEEYETYQMLTDQLKVIISSLPPYAVARLNSDKLEELNVSTKIQVRSDVYKGVMEEDESSARIRHQQQQAAQATQAPRQTPQRAPSFHSATPYQSGAQYNRQFQMPNQTPVPVPNHYQQSPVRAQMPPSYQRQVSAPMTNMTPQPHRSATGPFARPNGWTGQQSMQPLRGYGTPGAAPPFQGTPGQPRAASNYQQHAQPGGTPSRFPQGYQGYNAQQQAQPGMSTQYQQQQSGNIPPHMNGAGGSPQRHASPQVSMSLPGGMSYSPRTGQQSMPQARPYGNQGQPGGHATGIPHFPSNGVHPSQAQNPVPGSGQGGWSAPMTAEQRVNYQNAQRALALERTNQFNNKMQQNQLAISGNHQGVSGLGGIGISAQPPNMQKMHMRAGQFGSTGPSSPSPRLPGAPSPAGMNGMPQQNPSPSPGPIQGATPSPAPSATLAKPPTPA